MIPDVTDFEILPGHKIRVALSNGKKGVFDVKPYLDKGVFKELHDDNYFRRAKLEGGTIVWPNEQDFSPETLEARMETT